MKDLDMSDVLADARDMLDQQLMRMYNEFDKLSDAELEEFRYWARIRAHAENDTFELRALDDILLRRHSTLCEGCLGRYGCEMCCPSDFSWMADAYNREAEENMLGRPLFPNEY